jgi:hypothetical protein
MKEERGTPLNGVSSELCRGRQLFHRTLPSGYEGLSGLGECCHRVFLPASSSPRSAAEKHDEPSLSAAYPAVRAERSRRAGYGCEAPRAGQPSFSDESSCGRSPSSAPDCRER